MLPNLSQLARTDGTFVNYILRGNPIEEQKLRNWDDRAGHRFPKARYYFYGLVMGSCYSVDVKYVNERAHVRIRHDRKSAVFEDDPSTNVVGLTIQNCTVDKLSSKNPTPNIDQFLKDYKTWEIDVSLSEENDVLEGAVQHMPDQDQGDPVKLIFKMQEVEEPERRMRSNTTWHLFERCD